MSKQKNAAHGAATPGRQSGAGPFSGDTTSAYYNTTQGCSRQPGMIERLLSPGAENAVPLAHLVKLTELPARQVRQQIQAERLRGAQILADNQHGYFLPESKADVDEFVKSMFHRAFEITRAANAVQRGGGPY